MKSFKTMCFFILVGVLSACVNTASVDPMGPAPKGMVYFQGYTYTQDEYDQIMEEIVTDCAEHGC